MGTPDLSPRGDMEAEDPPTPRMYKAIIPTAASGQMQNHASAPHSPKVAPEATQLVLHQGHFNHDRQHASPQRPARHTGQDQAMEDLRHTVRHALTGSMSCGNGLQQQALSSYYVTFVSLHMQVHFVLVLDCPVKCLLLYQLGR